MNGIIWGSGLILLAMGLSYLVSYIEHYNLAKTWWQKHSLCFLVLGICLMAFVGFIGIACGIIPHK